MLEYGPLGNPKETNKELNPYFLQDEKKTLSDKLSELQNELKKIVDVHNKSKAKNDVDLELTNGGKLRVFKKIDVNNEKKLPRKYVRGWDKKY
jgi:hypothetical protein